MSEQPTKTLSEFKHWKLRAMVAERQRKELRTALAICLRVMSCHCRDLHHEKADQHAMSDDCPVEKRIREKARAVLART